MLLQLDLVERGKLKLQLCGKLKHYQPVIIGYLDATRDQKVYKIRFTDILRVSYVYIIFTLKF